MATTRCQYQLREGVGPDVNKFENVYIDDHQMSVAFLVLGIGGRSHVWYLEGRRYPYLITLWVIVTWGPCYPTKQNDRQTPVKI